MWKSLEVIVEPKLVDPVLLICLSTSAPQYQILYSQAGELADFIVLKTKSRRFASFYSSALPPAVKVDVDGVAELVGVHFFHVKGKNRDFVLLSGYSSPTRDEFEFANEILIFSKKIGVKEFYSIGARWNEQPISPTEEPKVLGFASDSDGAKWLERNGAVLLKDEPAFYFSNLIIPMAKTYSMKGYKLSVNHGEPRPHPKSLISLLGFLSVIGLEVDTSELYTRSKELEEAIKKSGGQVAPPGIVGAEYEEELEPQERPPERGDIYR